MTYREYECYNPYQKVCRRQGDRRQKQEDGELSGINHCLRQQTCPLVLCPSIIQIACYVYVVNTDYLYNSIKHEIYNNIN